MAGVAQREVTPGSRNPCQSAIAISHCFSVQSLLVTAYSSFFFNSKALLDIESPATSQKPLSDSQTYIPGIILLKPFGPIMAWRIRRLRPSVTTYEPTYEPNPGYPSHTPSLSTNDEHHLLHIIHMVSLYRTSLPNN